MIPTMPSIEGVGIILHGSETCDNDWLRPFLRNETGDIGTEQYKIRFVFVTYATDLIDNVNVFQWPLGVAAYAKSAMLHTAFTHSIRDLT